MKIHLVTTIFSVLYFCSLTAQTEKIEYPFSLENGFKGVAYIHAEPYFDTNYQLELSLEKVLITEYKTSIGHFSGNELAAQGLEFPIICSDCSFTLEGTTSTIFFDQEHPVQINISTSTPIQTNTITTFTIPFEIPETAHRYEQYKNDWQSSGKFQIDAVENLNGSIFKSIIEKVRAKAKANADEEKLDALLSDINHLDTDEKIKKLYQSRSGFYNKATIDNLIKEINNGTYRPVEISTKKTELTNEVVEVQTQKKWSSQPNKTVVERVAKKTQHKQIDDRGIQTVTIPLEKENLYAPNTSQQTYIKSVENKTASSHEAIAAPNLSSLLVNEEATVVEENSNLSTLIEEEPTSLFAGPPREKKLQKRNSAKSISKLSNYHFDFSTDLSKYKRSSLHTIMIRNPGAEQAEVIEETFLNRPLPEKFNSHFISTHFISVPKKARKQDKEISSFLDRNHIAKELVAKWFNRNEKGEFNMDLIAERGHYNATVFDINIARKSERGLTMLADAGEQLIANTFVIVNDYKYTNKEEVAKKTGFFTNLVSIAASAAGANDLALIADAATVATGVAGKGYVVKVTSYLYRLKWNEQIAHQFYENFWVDENSFDLEKKLKFDNTDLFKLELLGYETDYSGIQSSAFTSKSNAELIERATIKATDQTISKLQRKFEIFRTKTPIISTEPLAAKIGLKEGLEKGDKFEVLEQYLTNDGTIAFNRVGVIKVNNHHIWDNRYGALEENNSSFEYTTFTGNKNKYYQGMLLRQIN